MKMVLFFYIDKKGRHFMKEWIFSINDKDTAMQLAQECEIDSFTAYLLCSKGICEPFEADEFLSDEITLQDPYMFIDIEKAAERISSAVESEEKIAVFGDYDCDGVTSTVLLYSVLKELGADCVYRVPTRDEGYGMSVQAVDELKQKGVGLIVTVDNGITAFDSVNRANELGIDVVVTDHHLPSDMLPDAYAVVDPKRSDCSTEFKDYAGVGVAFMLCSVLLDTPPEDLLYTYGDLVTIGTIADVMPLKSDNRAIVKNGLKVIKRGNNAGINALINASGITRDKITSTNIAFTIAPRINATGRVFHPEKAIELLLCDDETKAEEKANELCSFNNQRKELESEILSDALNTVYNDEKMQNSPVIVVGGENWHHGVIGIVASKLCSIFSRPAVVFSLDESLAVGSARGYEGASIYEILSGVSDFAESFGGHSSAAGITVKRENFEKVKSSIQYSAKKIYPYMPFDKLRISCKLNPASLNINNVYAQKQLEPFGEGNERPVFALMNMCIVNIVSLSGGKHLKLIVSRSGGFQDSLEVMAFFTNEQDFEYNKGDKIDIAVTLDTSVYNGNEKLSVILKDIRAADFSQEHIIKDIRNYQNFKYFGDKSFDIHITRDDVVSVYKKIRIKQTIKGDEIVLLKVFQSNDYIKLKIILDVLRELEFINISFDGKYIIEFLPDVTRRDLSESLLFRAFS